VFGFYTFSQSDTTLLKRKVENNTKLFNNNLDSAFMELDELINSAVKANDSVMELKLLERKCRYYYNKNQLDDMIKASEILYEKAKEYDDVYTQAMSFVYLSEAYSVNQLWDRSLMCLEKAYNILDNDKSNSKNVFVGKSNVLGSYANTYIDMGKPEMAIKKLQDVINNFKVLENVSEMVQFQYLNYCNIAYVYTLCDMDSAKYYALKSISLKPNNQDDDYVMLTNYSVLGRVYKDKGSYNEALSYYKKAIHISEKSGEYLNLREIYGDVVEIYNLLGKSDSAVIFDNKLKELEISSLQSKYSSLQLLVDKNIQLDDKKDNFYIWMFFTIVGVLLVLVIVYLFIRSKRNKKSEFINSETYVSLIELVKNNDPGFLFSFEQVYPDFSKHLLEYNPQLTNSEIEFCALLKLNLSTKEIAQYKFIEPRTVQNKKYRMRKKLKIPGSVDIYTWFSSK